MKYYFLLLILSITLVSCDKKNDPTPIVVDPPAVIVVPESVADIIKDNGITYDFPSTGLKAVRNGNKITITLNDTPKDTNEVYLFIQLTGDGLGDYYMNNGTPPNTGIYKVNTSLSYSATTGTNSGTVKFSRNDSVYTEGQYAISYKDANGVKHYVGGYFKIKL
jgi:hypothetical protein